MRIFLLLLILVLESPPAAQKREATFAGISSPSKKTEICCCIGSPSAWSSTTSARPTPATPPPTTFWLIIASAVNVRVCLCVRVRSTSTWVRVQLYQHVASVRAHDLGTIVVVVTRTLSLSRSNGRGRSDGWSAERGFGTSDRGNGKKNFRLFSESVNSGSTQLPAKSKSRETKLFRRFSWKVDFCEIQFSALLCDGFGQVSFVTVSPTWAWPKSDLRHWFLSGRCQLRWRLFLRSSPRLRWRTFVTAVSRSLPTPLALSCPRNSNSRSSTTSKILTLSCTINRIIVGYDQMHFLQDAHRSDQGPLEVLHCYLSTA